MEVIDEQELLAPPQTLASLDLSTVTPQQLERIEHELHFTIARDGDFGGVCCWFDTPFDGQSPELSLCLNCMSRERVADSSTARRAWGCGGMIAALHQCPVPPPRR